MNNKPPLKEHYYYHLYEFFHTALNITRAFVEKDYSIDMHKQEFYELNIITNGEGIHYIEDNKLPAKAGDVFIIPPNVLHGYIGSKGFDVYHVLLSDRFMRKYITDLQQLPNFFLLFTAEPLMRTSSQRLLHLKLNENQKKDVFEILNKLSTLEDKVDSINSIIKSNICMILITYLCNCYSKTISNNDINNDQKFMKTISYIHQHYNEKITIEDLCKMSLLSRSSYIRKFKEICKMPPSTYINQRRIEAAKNMLITTSYTISEIAFNTGFYDAAHFIRTFEAVVQISPFEYRKKYKQNK